MTTNAERSATFREHVSRTIRAALRSGAGLACITGADLTSQPRSIATMAITDPKQTPATGGSATDKLEEIARILAVSGESFDDFVNALRALWDEEEQSGGADGEAASANLSARERALCASMKLSPAAYLASKNRMRAGGVR